MCAEEIFTEDELDAGHRGLIKKQENAMVKEQQLSAQQIMFVNHLFEANMDVGIAAERAAVTVKTAKDWVEYEGPVANYIADRLNEMSEATNLQVEDIVKGLLKEAQREPSGPKDKTVSHAARVSAWSHLAKYKGMMDKGSSNSRRKVSVNINIGGDVNSIEGESDECN